MHKRHGHRPQADGMTGRQRIVPARRQYNQWVADETLEDYALRFTAKSARRWSSVRVGNTALGAVSFLALEAIGGAITLSYGFDNAVVATLVVSVLLLLTGLPIAYYAARDGVDIDLLTRGAGFGYVGSTVTSLIYASFTFLLFAIEAVIMALALELCLGVPLALGYVISALVVLPIVTHGINWISRFQLWTQPIWLVLHLTPIVFIAFQDTSAFADWTAFQGTSPNGGALNLIAFGAASSVVFALIAQIGEQVDILRFMPAKTRENRLAWWSSLLASGAGWIVPGALKLLLGSFLAVLALNHGVPAERASEPTQMYDVAFGYVTSSPQFALALTGVFVVLSQLKINVTNAYAGSIAWSNFFSRLTHAHPGRIVWLVFNVAIALILMEAGIYKTLEHTLGLYSIVAVAWVGALVADLAVNKPLGLSPPRIEFKRAHLYDVNPVGVGAMTLATLAAFLAYSGACGLTAKALAPFVALGVAFVTAPLIAAATRGKFYLARKPRAHWRLQPTLRCSICEHGFESEDMAHCPVYSGPICSLCCSLDARCRDGCKPHARLSSQVVGALTAVLPAWAVGGLNSRAGHYVGVMTLLGGALTLVLLIVYVQAAAEAPEQTTVIGGALSAVFLILMMIAGIAAWLFVLAHESREIAQDESGRQTALLMKEIEAHKRTDAALQRAKEVAEAANVAKSRYVVGISHELRTPLNAVMGYAQLLDADETLPPRGQKGVRVIRRSAEHLSGLIDGLLDISKVEAGRLELARNEVRTRDFLDQLADMFRLQANAKGLEFRFDGAERLPAVVRCDEKRVRQILINLLSNAVKFTDAGHVALRVSYRSQIAEFTVTDTGAGIRVSDRERIFEPFERGEATRAKLQPGMGLGLTITKLLVEIMGGDLTLESVEGAGSTFRVKLMLSQVAAPRPSPAPQARAVGYEGPRKLVLVIDDDGDHRELMREALEPIGFNVIAAPDGVAALTLVDECRPDLFLLDVSMPGMSGWDVARRLRETGHVAPILMMSANIGDFALKAVETPDHDGALPKPCDLGALLRQVETLLDLVFVYDAPPPAAPPARAKPELPGPRHVGDLRRLGEMGYVRGIEAKLAELEQVEPGVAPFVAEARERLRAFDMNGYMALLGTRAPEETADG
ncbi:hybrid sensor histidine kinase/response regulator [Methylopila capsulata]|uniref:histidine kinase n=2 Tax=Methylopila capsulata TaxID=61654 RepID=A0A9W6MSH2_9HYPH|nr:hybrid sensor histidine kinase/response regulator [Methylopila capsulata]